MPEKTTSVPAANPDSICEAVCIHTNKVFDSCKDKDCIEDLRVYPTCGSQVIIDSAFSIRPRTAKLLCADVSVEEINFNRGCYTIDISYFYKVTGVAFPGEKLVTGLAIFDKRVILYGSEGSAKVFTSEQTSLCSMSNNLPVAVVEAVDPLPLNMKIVDSSCIIEPDCDAHNIPKDLVESFGDDLITTRTCKQLLVTLGQFSIVRLERDTQLLIPIYDYCIPDKECAGREDDPCTLFGNIPFPVNDFFPPSGDPDQCSKGTCF